jgi:potassium efflux system protein
MAKHRHRYRWLGCLLLGFWLVFSTPWASLAQTSPTLEPTSANVVLDGRPLFQVTAADPLTAPERAERINEQIQRLVDLSQPVEIEIEMRNESPILLANGRYLLTVTEQDAQRDGGGIDASTQAERWQDQITQALERAQEEREANFLQMALLQAAVVILLALAIHWLSGYLWRRTLRPTLTSWFNSRDEEGNPAESPTELRLLLNLVLSLVRLVLWGATLLYVTDLFPVTRQISYQVRRAIVTSVFARHLPLGERAFSVLDLAFLFLLLFGLVVVAGAVTNVLRSRILRLAGINRGMQEAVAIMVRYSVISVGTIVILQVWGLDLSSLALLASALSVGIGLGLQNIAKDFGSGLILVFERPIQVGEFVSFGTFMGTVERIGARSTEIKTLDQVSIIVPNSRFLEQEVINWSHRNPVSRIRVPVGVSYSASPSQVQEVLIAAGHDHPEVLSTPPPRVLFIGFGDSSLDFELMVWIAEPNKQLLIKSDLFFIIHKALMAKGIEIPFPQRDLHVRSGKLPLEMTPDLEQMVAKMVNAKGNGNGHLPS